MSITALESELLNGMKPRHREQVLALGVLRTMAEGDVVFHLGEETQGVYLVRKGRVNLTLPIRLGDRQEDILVEERAEGQLLGWSGLVPPYRFTLQAKTGTKTELLFIPRWELESLFAKRPEVAAGVYGNLAAIIGQRLQVFQAMWARGVQRRMAHGSG